MQQKNKREPQKRFTIQIRGTEERIKQMKASAKEAGMTVTDFIYFRTLQVPSRTKMATDERDIYIRLLAELGKIGSNVNQIAKHMNSEKGAGYSVTIKETVIVQALDGVRTTSNELLNLLEHGPGKRQSAGNGSQLAAYLQTKADNDNIRVLQIRGTCHPHDLRKSFLEMSLTSELTKSDKGLYHGLFCPDYGEDQTLTDADWIRAADIMEEERGYTGQKRAIVLHEKKGKTHAHIVWERYDHETGIMKSDSFSYPAQDRARRRIEIEFGHQLTPVRNKNRPVMKEYLTAMWQKTASADEFIQAIAGKGYLIAAGTQRPYMVVDETGRAFDLVRQLQGVRTKDVKERFKATRLVKEKEAIQAVRHEQATERMNRSQENAIDRIILHIKQVAVKAKTVKANDSTKDKAVANDNKEIEKEIKRQKILDGLKHQRLEKAKLFRENERDL